MDKADTRTPPKIGKWVSCDDHYPPTGQAVLGWWGGVDVEMCVCNCRNDGKREDDWWWETRCGDTATPLFWAEMDVPMCEWLGCDL
jgi:hypothetical protein